MFKAIKLLFYKILTTFFLFSISFKIKQKETYLINSKLKKFGNIKSKKLGNKDLKLKDNNIVDVSFKKCYEPLHYLNISIIHTIITRFLIEIPSKIKFPRQDYNLEYIQNGIRVMKKYLLNSLENQSCKDFIWILLVGDKVNMTYINSLLNFDNSFKKKIISQNELKKYLRNITKNSDVLITTRIDYDDGIYYDAVNDVRKSININKPILVHGYNRGVYYFETNGKYYDFIYNYKYGVWSVFISLIIFLNKVKDSYHVYELGDHSFIKKNILNISKLFGLKDINYEPTIFDNGDPKFIYTRQNYSGSFNYTIHIPKKLRAHYFNLSKFYGK